MARLPISKKVRFEVFKRDGFACQYCGAAPPAVVLQVDHIHPVADGGVNDQDNLVTACEGCNQGKGARSLSSVPLSLADKAALIAEKEEQLRGYYEVAQAKRKRLEEETWQVADVWMDQFRKDSINKGQFQSVRNFVEKLGVCEAQEAMELAVSRKPWSQTQCFKYFCGICWNKIKRGQSNA